jgi:hypothetical protein
LIEPVLTAWKAAHPSVSGHEGNYELREIVNAIRYQGRTGVQWDYLPHDLPPKSATYYYFAKWRDDAAVANEVAAINSPRYVAIASLTGGAPADFYQTASARLRTTTMASWTFITGRRPTPDEHRQVEYWKRANGVGTRARHEDGRDFDTTVYRNPTIPLAQVRVSHLRDPSTLGGTSVARAIWRDMFRPTLRFTDQDSVNGHLVPFRTAKQMRLTEYIATLAGQARRWLVYLPSNYRKLTTHGRTLPLVLAFHGRNGSGRYMAQQTGWHEVAEARGFIVVYPQAEPATGANIGFSGSIDAANPDVAVTLGILADVTTRFAVDTTRVIVTGVSQGAAFTNRLAVQYPHLFAAIAPCYSGHLNAASYTNPIVRTDVPLPVWQCRGVNEVPTDYPGGTAGEAAAKLFWRSTRTPDHPPSRSTAGPPPTSTATASPSTAGPSTATSAISGPKTLATSCGTTSCPATADSPTAPWLSRADADRQHVRNPGALRGFATFRTDSRPPYEFLTTYGGHRRVSTVPSIPWLTYAHGPDGRPLGPRG